MKCPNSVMVKRLGRTWESTFSNITEAEFNWKGKQYMCDLANDLLYELEAAIVITNASFVENEIMWHFH